MSPLDLLIMFTFILFTIQAVKMTIVYWSDKEE